MIDKIKRYYIEENHTQAETCDFFNISYSYFRKIITDNNIKKQSSRSMKKIIINKEEAYKYYIIENHTAEESALYFSTNYRTFMRWMKRYNIIKGKEVRLQNMFRTNIKKYGSKTKFGTKEFKEWRKENVDSIMKKIENTFIKKYGSKSYFESREAYDIWKMGTSKTEKKIYNKLLLKFKDTINHYKSEKYPFNCDFYIPSKDLYIEYQGFVTHWTEPFDEKNEEHKLILEKLKNNSNIWNEDIIHIWSESDPLKRKIAKDNKLNWIEFFTEKDFDIWFKEQ